MSQNYVVNGVASILKRKIKLGHLQKPVLSIDIC